MFFGDKLTKAVLNNDGIPLGMGLDPHLEKLPKYLQKKFDGLEGDDFCEQAAEAVWEFNQIAIRAAKGHVAAIKPQFAFYEQLGWWGMKTLHKTVELLKKENILIIADAKRGDISSTAEAYARGILADKGPMGCDSITLSPWMGLDTIDPFLPYCQEESKGLWVLLRTTNPKSGFLQLHGEPTSAEHLAQSLHEMGQSTVGDSGFSSVGVVVGAMAAEEAQKIRKWLPQAWFLVPGMGAQGGSVQMALAGCRTDGLGSLVLCSRSLLYPKTSGDLFETDTEDCIRQAILDVKQSLGIVLPDKRRLLNIQKRFLNATSKEHWKRLKTLLFSGDKENVVMGMNLLEALDEKVYYDGVCTFLEDDGKGNWMLKDALDCKNPLALKFEILRMAEENVWHEIKEAFDGGFLEEMFVGACGEIEVSDVNESQKERLLSKVSEMVEINSEEGNFLVMKYQVTQVLWESVMGEGENPSDFRVASRPVEQVSWLDCVILANKLSEKEGLEKVYEIPDGMVEACKNQKEYKDENIEKYAQRVKMTYRMNGYRLPLEAEWEYAARGGEDYRYAGSNDLDEVGWYDGNSGRKPHGVGQKKSNGYGLYDMSGNVWEWCFDAYDSSRRVHRGGSWFRLASNCGVSYRGSYVPSSRGSGLGVRLFRSVSLNS